MEPTRDTTFDTATMARIHRDQGRLDRAAAIYRHLLEQDPGNEEYRAALQEVLVLDRPASVDRLEALVARWIDLVLTGERLAGLGPLAPTPSMKGKRP